jgi:hypothetical protein
MPYIGHGVTNAGTFYVLDDLTMSSSTTYTLQVGSVSVTPKADNLLITLDGVIQHTPDAYTVSGSTLTFASAPGSGVDFYGIIMGQSASTGQGSIGAAELKVTGDGAANQFLAGDGDGTFTFKDGSLSTTTTTGDILYRANSSALARLAIGSTGQVLTVASGIPAWSTDTEAYLPSAGGTMSGNIAMGSNDISGGGTITGTFVGGITGNVTGNTSGSSGSTTGNAATATTLATARNINGVSFNGSAAITVTADANTLSGTTLKSTVVASSLTSVGTITTGVWNADVIASAKLDADTAHLSTTQTFSGAKTFSANTTFDGNVYINGSASSANYNLGIENTDTYTEFFATTNSSNNKGYKFYHSNTSGSLTLTLDTSKNATFAGHIDMADSKELRFGASDDLRLYHDGSNSYIKNTTGWLNMPMSGSGVSIANADFSESIARFLVDGACEFYHNGTKRIETTSSGATVAGNLTLNVAGDNLGLVLDPASSGSTTLRLDTWADNSDGRNWAFRNRYNVHGRLELMKGTNNTDSPLTTVQHWDNDGTSTFNGQITATGIKFDASGEVLDDYEEGIYQYKIYTSDGNSGTTAWTSRSGYTYFSYVRVGAICHVQGRYEVDGQGNASTSNSHYVHFSLPFAAVDLTDTSGTSCGSIAILRNPDGTGETQNAKIIVHEAQGGTYCVMPTIDGASESWFMAFSDSNWEGYFQLTYRVG